MGRFKSKQPLSQVPQGMPDGSPPPGYSKYDPKDWPKEFTKEVIGIDRDGVCLLYTSPSPRDRG